jgi:hypothetical protein
LSVCLLRRPLSAVLRCPLPTAVWRYFSSFRLAPGAPGPALSPELRMWRGDGRPSPLGSGIQISTRPALLTPQIPTRRHRTPRSLRSVGLKWSWTLFLSVPLPPLRSGIQVSTDSALPTPQAPTPGPDDMTLSVQMPVPRSPPLRSGIQISTDTALPTPQAPA